MLIFGLTAAAGYVAPRHIRAIKDTGNTLISVYNPYESLGILDQYFPDAECFSDFESVSTFHALQSIDYLSICSPDHHHLYQICWGLIPGANIICEKPLVISPEELDALEKFELQLGKKVNMILQLRLHPNAIKLIDELSMILSAKKAVVSIQYVTARGRWYFNSWKGRKEQSGGILTNIGIHLFDLLIWLFGMVEEAKVYHYCEKKLKSLLSLQRAVVEWSLSIAEADQPQKCKEKNISYYRELVIDAQSYHLDQGMEDLHTESYRESLAGNGQGITEAAPSVKLCHSIKQLYSQR